MKKLDNPMDRTMGEPSPLSLAPRCGARTRRGTPCQSKAANGKGRCRLHGGAKGSGAPPGSRNGNYRHGQSTYEAIAERKLMRSLLHQSRELLNKASRTSDLPPQADEATQSAVR